MASEIETNALFFVRHQLREKLVGFPVIIDGDPNRWWFKTARCIHRLTREIEGLPPEIQEYLNMYIPTMLGMLQNEARLGLVPEVDNISEYKSLRTETRMLELSMMMAEPFDTETKTVTENITPLEELVNRHPGNFQLVRKTIQSIEFIDFRVRPSVNHPFSHLLIPEHYPIGHKGGGPRGVFDIDQEAPQSMIESEFPWSDIDVAGAGEEHGLREVADIMGADPDGLEVFPGSTVDFSSFALGRDTDQNQLFLDKHGLHYSDEARLAAITGRIKIVGGYQPNKAIYGKDLFTINGITLAKPRGLMRLVKPLAEGKALEWEYMNLNSIMDFGVFYLFLGRKWKNKEKFGLYMQRMFHIGKQMLQTRKGEENIMQVFERVHTQYPFYDMDKQIDSLRELVRYMSGKLIKQIDREFGWKYKIPSGIALIRTPGDDIPRKISLDGFTPSPAMNHQINKWWPGFLLECRERTDAFNRKPPDPIFKYFIKAELQDAETGEENN